jgi:hypothetical protein
MHKLVLAAIIVLVWTSISPAQTEPPKTALRYSQVILDPAANNVGRNTGGLIRRLFIVRFKRTKPTNQSQRLRQQGITNIDETRFRPFRFCLASQCRADCHLS